MNLRLSPPALIFYSDNLPDGVAGQAKAFVVRIRPEYRTDVGLEMHELEHVKQWWMTLGLHPLLYAFCRPYRAWSETKAYRIQTQYPDRRGHFMTVDEASRLLTLPRYDLGLSVQEARIAIANA